jgi:preprotein translocase subunit SecF
MKWNLGNIQVFPHNYYFDFMKWRKITVGLSLLCVIASLLIIGIQGLNYSIDFLGGAEIQVNLLDTSITRDSLLNTLKKGGFAHTEVIAYHSVARTDNGQTFVIRIKKEKNQDNSQTSSEADEVIHYLKNQIGKDSLQISSIKNISGKIGKEEEHKGYMALLLSCIGILIYIAFRFDSRFAPGAVLCLLHNVIIALGVMTLLNKPFTISSIAAFLTIVGYSINDTVIVYDRIRETRLHQPRMPMINVVNHSISQTMNRTVLTSTTGIAALVVLTLLGGGSIEDFALTMLVGIVVGTYSSIYVAAPLTLMMDGVLTRMGWVQKDPVAKAKRLTPEAPGIYVRKKPTDPKK